jgi:hypothetical protein
VSGGWGQCARSTGGLGGGGAARYSGVPFYVFNGRWSLVGAQPVEVFGHAIDAGRGERVT